MLNGLIVKGLLHKTHAMLTARAIKNVNRNETPLVNTSHSGLPNYKFILYKKLSNIFITKSYTHSMNKILNWHIV